MYMQNTMRGHKLNHLVTNSTTAVAGRAWFTLASVVEFVSANGILGSNVEFLSCFQNKPYQPLSTPSAVVEAWRDLRALP